MDDDLISKAKRTIIIFVNMGVFVVLVGAMFTGGVLQLPETTEIERSVKVVLMSISGFVILFGIVAWDILAGINTIEQKLKDIENKQGK